MKNILFLLTVLIYIAQLKAQNEVSINENITECDSTLSYSHPNKHYTYYRMGRKLIEHKLFVEKLNSYKDSAAEYKIAEKYGKIAGAGFVGLAFNMLFITPVLCSVFATPVFGLIPVGCIVCSIIYSKKENKHFLRSIKLYNQHIC